MKVSKKQLIMGLFGVKNLGTCKLINDLIDSQLTAVVKLCICNVDKQKFIIRHVLQSWVQFKESYSKMNHPFSCKKCVFLPNFMYWSPLFAKLVWRYQVLIFGDPVDFFVCHSRIFIRNSGVGFQNAWLERILIFYFAMDFGSRRLM